MGGCDVEGELGPRVTPADVGEHVLDVGRLQVAPTVLVEGAARDIRRNGFAATSELELPLDMAERTAGDGGFDALEAESVLQPDVERAAKSIEAEDGIGALEIYLVDRDVRDEVPVDGIAERLIEPHAVDVDGQSLRRTLQWRRCEATVKQSRLERIAGCRHGRNASHLAFQRSHQLGHSLRLQILLVQDVCLGWNEVAVEGRPNQRGGRHDLDRRQFGQTCLSARAVTEEQRAADQRKGERAATIDRRALARPNGVV